MSAQIVTQADQATQTAKPKMIAGTPWAWGFEDGSKGVTVYAGYHLFTGKKLVEYKRGWQEARKLKAM